MANRFTRFLRLERPHAGKGDAPKLANEQRFEHEELGSDAEIERLREARRRQFASGVETAEEPADAQPFTRCGVCEADNSRYIARCMNCGANLDTPEQRDFNEALWSKRRAEQATAPAGGAEPFRDPRFTMGVEIAREVGRREEERLSWMASGPGVPMGIRILAALPQGWRSLVVGGVLAEIAITGLWAWHTGEQSWGLACGISIAIVFGLFLPSRRRTRFFDDV
jgi:hypothetical protein